MPRRTFATNLSRLYGVGEVTVFGTANYSMRIWLNPKELKTRGLTTEDVANAVREQNVQVAAGQIGQPPVDGKNIMDFQYTVTTLGRLSDVEQFENIIVRTADRTKITRLKDVARVELGAQTYDQYNLIKGRPTANIGIFQLPGSNALDVVREIRQEVAKLSKSFPKGMSVRVSARYDEVRRRIDSRRLRNADRSRRARAARDPGVPARLAGTARARDHRAGYDHRRVFRHVAARVQRQHAHAVRPGAGDRHRRG